MSQGGHYGGQQGGAEWQQQGYRGNYQQQQAYNDPNAWGHQPYGGQGNGQYMNQGGYGAGNGDANNWRQGGNNQVNGVQNSWGQQGYDNKAQGNNNYGSGNYGPQNSQGGGGYNQWGGGDGARGNNGAWVGQNGAPSQSQRPPNGQSAPPGRKRPPDNRPLFPAGRNASPWEGGGRHDATSAHGSYGPGPQAKFDGRTRTEKRDDFRRAFERGGPQADVHDSFKGQGYKNAQGSYSEEEYNRRMYAQQANQGGQGNQGALGGFDDLAAVPQLILKPVGAYADDLLSIRWNWVDPKSHRVVLTCEEIGFNEKERESMPRAHPFKMWLLDCYGNKILSIHRPLRCTDSLFSFLICWRLQEMSVMDKSDKVCARIKQVWHWMSARYIIYEKNEKGKLVQTFVISAGCQANNIQDVIIKKKGKIIGRMESLTKIQLPDPDVCTKKQRGLLICAFMLLKYTFATHVSTNEVKKKEEGDMSGFLDILA